MKRLTIFIIAVSVALIAGCATTGSQSRSDSDSPDKVVYHFSDGLVQASNGLRNIGNHLEVNPKAKIVVVAHALGVDFLMNDAKDKNGNPYEITVQGLKSRGVEFQVCQITLRNRNLKKAQFIEEVTYVPSGVAQVARLQQREGYAYIKP